MNTVLTEKKNNMMLVIILVISLLCVGASGFMWYKASSISDANTAKIAELEKTLKSLQDNNVKQTETIKTLNVQLENASKEKTMLLAEIDSLKVAASKPVVVPPPVVVTKPEPVIQGRVESVSAVSYFDFGKFDIKPEYESELLEVAKLIKKKRSALVIEGHTDQIGDKDYNVWLSKQRADAVKNFILKNSAPEAPCNIISIGVGSAKQENQNIPNKDKRKVLVTAVEDCKGAL